MNQVMNQFIMTSFTFFFIMFILFLASGICLFWTDHSVTGTVLCLAGVVLLATGIVLDSIKNQTLQLFEVVLNSYEEKETINRYL